MNLIPTSKFFGYLILLALLRTNIVCCDSQSIWYPLWMSKDQGSGSYQNVRIGSNMYHIPNSLTDSPVHVDLLPETTSLSSVKFPDKIGFLLLRNNQCLLQIPRKREGNVYKRRFIAMKDGIFPSPEDENKFVICHKGVAGNIDCLEINCPKGTQFDSDKRKFKVKRKIHEMRKRHGK